MIKKYFLSLWVVLFLLPIAVFAQDKNQLPQKLYHFVFFNQGRSNIEPAQWSELEALIWDFKLSGCTINHVEIHGYADAATERKNPKLAFDRADVVKETFGGFGIPFYTMLTTGGNATATKENTPEMRRRVTVCVHYTGNLKRAQPQKVSDAFDPNFDKKIIASPAGSGVPKSETAPKTDPVPTPPAKAEKAKAQWD